jgi:hypothetical protein
MRKLIALGLQWKTSDESGDSKHGKDSKHSEARPNFMKGVESVQGVKSERISWHEFFYELFAFFRCHGHTNVQVSGLTSISSKMHYY